MKPYSGRSLAAAGNIIVGHNLRFDAAMLTRTVERLTVTTQDATFALDAWHKAYSKVSAGSGLKGFMAEMLNRRPTVGEVVEVRRFSVVRRLARVLSTSDGAKMHATVRVIYLDTHAEDTIEPWEAFELEDPIDALAWLANLL